ncbi:cyclin C, partial [Ramicandelaber brevisporus]
DYWASTQRQLWCLDPLALAMAELPDLEHVSPAELRHVRIFYALFIQNIGKRCQLRQECIATAIVYFRRFYARNNLCDSDPTLTAVTSVYVASKVSEMPMHLSQLCSESKSAALEKGLPFPYDVTNIVEFEFYLLEELEFCLIVYLPYQTLLEVANATRLDKQIMQQTWWIINNSFTSDVCLVHPPHMIALAALMIA